MWPRRSTSPDGHPPRGTSLLCGKRSPAVPECARVRGGVVLEALTSGVVPIVVDYGGPGELVTETTGIKVPLAERDAIVRGLHAGLEQLLAAPARRATMAAVGQRRVDDLFTWQRKAAQISAVYAWSTGETCAKPHFAFSGEGTDEPGRTRNGGISHRPSHPLTA